MMNFAVVGSRRLFGNRRAVAAVGVAVVVVAAAAAAPLLVRLFGVPGPGIADPHALNAFGLPTGLSGAHPFGVDDAGRDLLAEVLYGLRSALWQSFLGTVIAFVIALALSCLARLPKVGRAADVAARFCASVIAAFPVIVLGLALGEACGAHGCAVAGLGGGSGLLVVAVAAAGVAPAFAALRAVPRQPLAAKIVPTGAWLLGTGVVLIAALTFLGVGPSLRLGVQTRLGSLIAQGGDLVLQGRPGWWLIVFPGAVVAVASIALHNLAPASLPGAAELGAAAERRLAFGLGRAVLVAAAAVGLTIALTSRTSAGTSAGTLAGPGPSAAKLLVDHLPATVSLLLGGGLIAVVIVVLVTVLSQSRESVRVGVNGFARRVRALPISWLALLALYLFARDIGRLPVLPGAGSYRGLTSDPADWFTGLVLPWLVLALTTAALLGSRVWTSREGALSGPAAGLGARAIRRRRLRAAALGLLSLTTVELGAIVGAAVLIEVAFRLPGDGALLAGAASSSGSVLRWGVASVAALVVIVDAVLRSIRAWLDPRERAV
jgi:peptide/nickel transport system permease protein